MREAALIDLVKQLAAAYVAERLEGARETRDANGDVPPGAADPASVTAGWTAKAHGWAESGHPSAVTGLSEDVLRGQP